MSEKSPYRTCALSEWLLDHVPLFHYRFMEGLPTIRPNHVNELFGLCAKAEPRSLARKRKKGRPSLGDDKQAATERSPPPLAGVSAIACFTFRSVARA